MIKSTFYNLPQEKKERLYSAAKKEFTRVPYSEVSINKIIKDAEISRGSFYTYFDDKSDLVRCLMAEYFHSISIHVEEALEYSDGDIFEMFIRFFDITVEYTELKNDIELFHSLFRSIRSSADFEGPLICDEKTKQEHINNIISKINKQKLNIKNDNELKDLLELMFIVTKQSISKALSKSADKDEARNKFIFKLNVIKYGAAINQNTEGKHADAKDT